ncbi:DNA-dependent protein kinase catalytic subunit-like [Liolophura sinensis]|uniref:DNA-dependent protein kinase catalytic subunit-like n=1 Tax=Liolophura sinensis TaxID=3198878 RepID=UPI00315823D4
MAVTRLEESVRSLRQCLPDSEDGSIEDADSLVADICQIGLHEIDEKDIDLCCSVLFDKSDGIITYLQKIVTIDQLQSCKANLLIFLSEFIQKVGKKVLPYAVDIKDVCVSLFSRDRFAKVKVNTFPVLTKLIEITVGSQMGEELKIQKLIEKFFFELSKSASKLTSTVKQGIYILLGVIAEVYPEYMVKYADRLTGLYVNAIKTEMTTKARKAELTVIAGCLEGLASCLVNFTQSAEEGAKHAYEIFRFSRSAIDPELDVTRYSMPKAGLKLLARHASQFCQYLIEDYEGMYEKFHFWSHHHNRDMSHLGSMAMESFLSQISEMLTQRAKEGTKEGAIFKFFIKKFRTVMDDTSASSKQISLAIKGYGLLAAPCKLFLTSADVQYMFSEMIQKSEQQFISNTDGLDDKLVSLPSYLDALANIVKEVDEISETFVSSLERLLVLMIENYPNVHRKIQFLCSLSILRVLLAVQPKGATYSQLLAGTVYQGVIRMCSHPVALDTSQTDQLTGELPEGDRVVRQISYKDYLSLWSAMLDCPSSKDLAKSGIGIEERTTLAEGLHDELVMSVLKMLNKLDLSSSAQHGEQPEAGLSEESGMTSEADQPTAELTTADPLSGIHANKPKDFQLFINLVEFSRDLFPGKHYSCFKKWVFPFGYAIILQSTKLPLVSGFYKLLAMCMKISTKLDLFKGSSESDSSTMEVDQDPAQTNTQTKTCFLLFSKFAKEVLVRMKQFRDDLLAACLSFILALPKEIVITQILDIIPAIQTAFTLGLSYLPLASLGLDALEYWSYQLPSHILKPHYKDILPYLDSYLKTGDQGADLVADSSVMTVTKKKGKGKKLPVRLVRETRDERGQSSETGLSVVKQRIVRYLGSLGGELNHNLLFHTEEIIARKALAWDTQLHLKFSMPFIDMKPSIHFDPFLPLIVELATSSSDRQTKVFACELLHSLVLYTLGRGAQRPGETTQKFRMDRIYRRLFPVILQLACDVERVAQQLFEPLTVQLIHWFTNNKKAESAETMALLDTIYDGIVQAKDTGLRDFSAKCLKEFLKWSIKQTSKKQQEKSPINAKSVLKRLYSFALHPSAFKRLGAALAFNNIYTIFREEESLVDQFTFDLLKHFVESLAIAHKDDKSLGTQEHCSKALEHLERILKAKSKLLSTKSKHRIEPHDWSQVTLDIAVRWLLRQSGRPQTECRHACMKLVYQLCALVSGVKTPKEYFSAFLKSKTGGPNYFLNRFEGGGQTGRNAGIACFPQLTDMADTFSLSTAMAWFDLLLAALDCYCWVLGEGLLTPADLFTGKNSKVFESVSHFVEKVALTDISTVASMFHNAPHSEFFTPREVEDYNRLKCTVLVRVLNFLTLLLGKYPKDAEKVVPPGVWSANLWEITTALTVHPTSLGFNLGDVEVMLGLPQEVDSMLSVFSKCLPSSVRAEFTAGLKRALSGPESLIKQIPLDFSQSDLDHLTLEQTISGYKRLHSVGLLIPAVKHLDSQQKLAQKLFSNVLKGIVTESENSQLSALTLSPSALAVAKGLLELALNLGLQKSLLVESLLDKTPVSASSRGCKQYLGELFFAVFKQEISIEVARSSEDVIPLLARHAKDKGRKVCSILVASLDYVSRDKKMRKCEGESLVKMLLSNWSRFSIWWDKSATVEQMAMSLLLTTKVILIDSKAVSKPDSTAFPEVFAMYQAMLTDSKLELSFKNQALDLLPFFCDLPAAETDTLKDCLNRLVADHFPLKSAEFTKGTAKYADYAAALDKILAALEMTGSLMLLELVISILCRESNHVYEEEILSALSGFIKRLPADKHKLAVDIPYAIFSKESGFSNEIRRRAVENVTLPLLRQAHKTALIEFFLDNIIWLMEIIQCKTVKGSESQLINKLCCFQLLELLYSRLSREEVNSKTSSINNKYCKGKVDSGKEMTQAVTKMAHLAKSEDMRGESTLLELRRQYHCAAYNALIAVISCTQTEQKFYVGFLFSENEVKGQFLWDNLVDKEKNYEFSVELTSPLERKKRFVSIRTERQEEESGGDADSLDTSGHSPSYHLASQYLADSSLSEDLNQFDFTMATAQQSVSGRERNFIRSQLRKKKSDSSMEADKTEVTVLDDYVELEQDELNQHDCMAPLIAVLKHMQRNSITPAVKQDEVPNSMPTWMNNLYQKLCDPTSHLNVKLFITKLIINTAEVFQPYAKFWLRGLMQLIVSGHLGMKINYMVVDLVVTMLSWHHMAIPADSVEDKALCLRVVEFLMSNAFHENRAVFRNNLEMLRTLIQCWKPRVEIPYRVVYEQFKPIPGEPKSMRVSTGVQLMGVILAAKLPPYGPTAPVDREKYLVTLAGLMNHHYKTVYAAASEVMGMVFRHLAEVDKETEGALHTYVGNLLTSLQSSRQDSFIVCAHGMHKHYPQVADRFINRLLFILPSLHGEFRPLCLEIILSRVDQVENVFLELKQKGLHKLLETRDEATQLLALKIVKAIMEKMQPPELLSVMPLLCAFVSHSSATCRLTMYEVLMWIYDNYREDDTPESHQIMGQTKECLLRGLADEDEHCRLQLQNFWTSETRLPGNTLDRLVAMLEAMYTPATESQYLGYATNLLMEMTSKSPDFHREVFEHPLSECKFEDMSIQSSWRQRHAAMTPLFAETQASQSHSMQSATVGDTIDGVRATLDAQQFTPTQDMGGNSKAPFNWLTGSSLETYAETPSISASDSASSLMFKIGSMESTKSSDRRGKFAKVKGSNFGQERKKIVKTAAGNSDEASKGESEIIRLKRRFMKDNEAKRVFFMKRQTRLNKMREEAKKEQLARREHQVTMYRKYRIGDLPDIQIKHSDLIAPLQAVAQRNSAVAKLLFSSLFRAIFAEMDTVKTDREVTETVGQINHSLETMMTLSTQYYAPFISSILDIAHHLQKKLFIDPGSVGTCTITSHLQPLGIVVLEGQLLSQDNDEPRSNKRAKLASSSTSVSQDVSMWLELARLYKSVDEYDVLRGIFSGKVNTKEVTHRALESEARGDYAQAYKLYDGALSEEKWPDGNPLQAEIDLWDDCQIQCCVKLSDWSRLEQITGAVDSIRGDNLSKIWEDTYHQEHYLPYLLRSKLKLMLQGDNQQSLLSFVDQAMKSAEQKAVLENNHCEELAMMYIWQNDMDRARYYTRRARNAFFQDWSSTDDLMSTSRISRLQTLQRLTELQEFLDFMAVESNFTSPLPAASLIRRWERRLPDLVLDPVEIWDDVITNRGVFMNLISQKLSGLSDSELMETEQDTSHFLDTKIRLKLGMARAAREQNNFNLTLKILKQTYKSCKAMKDERGIVEWNQLYAQTHQKKCACSLEWTDDTINNLLTTFSQLDKHNGSSVLSACPSLSQKHAVLQGQGYELLAETFLVSDILQHVSRDIKDKMFDLVKTGKGKDEDLIARLVEHGHQHLKCAVSQEMDQSDARDLSADKKSNTHITMATFCDKFLRITEDDGEDVKIASGLLDSFPETIVLCVLTAMKQGSAEARQRFPRLLQLAEYYPDTIPLICSKISEVPSWMFISWISQMMALLDKAEAPTVHTALLSLAKEYPQAVIYPYKISREGFVFENSALGKKNKAVVEKLGALLDDSNVPLVSKWISALEQFGQPNMLFKDWVNDIRKRLTKGKRDKDEIKRLYMDMFRELLNPRGSMKASEQASIESDTAISVVEMGDYRRKFAQKYMKDMEASFGKDGSKLAEMSLSDFAKKANFFVADMNKAAQKPLAPPGQLKEYCRWMSEFSYTRLGRALEIPGQYHGKKKPLPEYHVKIAGFDQRVKVMSSLRKPKRVTIRGNDEKEYNFLVKGGEDLRQDQRIEQLFGIMNEVFDKDASCRHRKLHLTTYQVIPMTPRVGLIEWLDNTVPLKEFLFEAMTEQELNFYNSGHGPAMQHRKWTEAFGGQRLDEMYGYVYKKYSRTETIKEFHMKEGKVPWDLLRRAFQQMSTSPEAFHVLRCRCAVTHALISISQYMLGIGDRHLSNFMISLTTGRMIGIDFGHAFGSATQFLPIPELMPFRLTRQLRNLMLPLEEKGLLESTMTHGLRALRQDSDLLLNTMDVFIKEPSLDWQQFAEKQQKEGMETEDANIDSAWYPRQKIRLAKRKFHGDNPAFIMRDELRLGHSRNKAFSAFESVLLGDKRENARGKLPATGLSVEQQVEALIDHATDPNILGRTYRGWEPWV